MPHLQQKPWHLSVLPFLPVPPTPLARLLLRSQAGRKATPLARLASLRQDERRTQTLPRCVVVGYSKRCAARCSAMIVTPAIPDDSWVNRARCTNSLRLLTRRCCKTSTNCSRSLLTSACSSVAS